MRPKEWVPPVFTEHVGFGEVCRALATISGQLAVMTRILGDSEDPTPLDPLTVLVTSGLAANVAQVSGPCPYDCQLITIIPSGAPAGNITVKALHPTFPTGAKVIYQGNQTASTPAPIPMGIRLPKDATLSIATDAAAPTSLALTALIQPIRQAPHNTPTGIR